MEAGGVEDPPEERRGAGELMALRTVDVELEAGRIWVERSYDPKERAFVNPKSEKGRRTVPMPAVLVPTWRRANFNCAGARVSSSDGQPSSPSTTPP